MSGRSSFTEEKGSQNGMGSSQFLPSQVAGQIKSEKVLDQSTNVEDLESALKRQAEGSDKFHKLSWQKLTICLIVEAIALGSLSMPETFASLGMVLGVILTVGIGFLAIYTSDIVGAVFCKFPETSDYAEAGRLMFGNAGYWIFGVMLCLFLR